MIRIFISYAHADEALRQELGKHLASLKYQGLVEVWHDRLIDAGEEWAHAIDTNLQSADVILLLVSADFIASPYCYEVELKEAMRRHDVGEAVVIPVILRPCDWHPLPFGKIQAATQDGRSIVKFPTWDEGFLEVVQAIKVAAMRHEDRRGTQVPASPTGVTKSARSSAAGAVPRSSNLHVKRAFTDHDRDQFRTQTFDYIASFFENSLRALEGRNVHLKTQFRRRDAISFDAAVYEDGRQAARCGIWLAVGHFGGDIAFSQSGLGNGNSFNESMSVSDDGHLLGLKPLGMGSFSGQRDQLLTLEGAAEYFWAMFIHPLQQR